MTTNLKGLATVRKTLADGRVTFYCYAWRGGPLLRSPTGDRLQPNDPALPLAFAAEQERRRNPQTNDLAMLIREFRQSSDFRSKSPATRGSYESYLDLIRSEFGALDFRELENIRTRGKFKAWRDTMADRLRTADYAWSTLARVLSFAKDRGYLSANVAERGGRLYSADRADKIWREEDIAQFEAVAPSCLRLALMMALWTGQRQGDLLRAEWPAYDGETLKVRQSKTGARVNVPVGRPLSLALDGMHGKGGTILTNTHGKALDERWFQNLVAKGLPAGGHDWTDFSRPARYCGNSSGLSRLYGCRDCGNHWSLDAGRPSNLLMLIILAGSSIWLSRPWISWRLDTIRLDDVLLSSSNGRRMTNGVCG